MRRCKLFISIALRTVLFTLLNKALSIFKISFVLGSASSYFSFSGISLPLAGKGKSGSLVATCIAIIQLSFKIFISGALLKHLHMLAFIVPGWASALYWAHNTALIRVCIPALCMIFFIMHPVGFWACPYTLYWLVPIAFYYTKSQTIFANALGSTFVAHAVGSTIWLYTMPMTITDWYLLIPLVAAERLFYALGMTIVVYLWQKIQQHSSRYRTNELVHAVA